MASDQRRRRRKRSAAAASTSLEEDYTTRRSRFDTESITTDQPRHSEASPQYDFRISTRRISRGNSPVQTNSRKLRRSTRTSSITHNSDHSATNSSSRLEPSNRLDELFELNPDPGNTSDNDVVITDTVRESNPSPAILDDIFTVEPMGGVTSRPHPPGHEQLTVTVNVRNGSNSGVGDEVIVVDSEDDDEDQDVMVTRETTLNQDELMARRLQAQYHQDSRFRTETFGTAVSTRRLVSPERRSGTGNEIIRDNMDALATRIDNWTTADARRLLMLRIPPNVRGGRRFGHHSIERQLVQTNPMLLFAAMMGGGSAIPSGVSNMGSYEDLLELAEQLGPGRPTGLSDTTINCLNTRQYLPNDSSSADPSSQNCVICMDKFELSQSVKTLAPCQHDFHSTCIDRWLKNHKTCPICRCEVRSPSISLP